LIQTFCCACASLIITVLPHLPKKHRGPGAQNGIEKQCCAPKSKGLRDAQWDSFGVWGISLAVGDLILAYAATFVALP
jgi:hypothetical protein